VSGEQLGSTRDLTAETAEGAELKKFEFRTEFRNFTLRLCGESRFSAFGCGSAALAFFVVPFFRLLTAYGSQLTGLKVGVDKRRPYWRAADGKINAPQRQDQQTEQHDASRFRVSHGIIPFRYKTKSGSGYLKSSQLNETSVNVSAI
jgi:hypothetical protein